MDAFVEATAAGVGGIISCGLLYPLEVIKDRMQATTKQGDGDEKPTVGGTARQIYKESGAAGFSKGVQYACTGSCSEKFIYFYAYNYLKKLAEGMQGGGPLSTTLNLVVGSVSDFAHLPFTQPLETVLMQLKSDTTGANALQIFQRCLKDTGIMGFYKGVPSAGGGLPCQQAGRCL